jgi:hypothetical protein
MIRYQGDDGQKARLFGDEDMRFTDPAVARND